MQEQLQELVDQWRVEANIPGVSVGIVHGDNDIVVTSGIESVETQLPVTDKTMFMIGSTTKVFAATAAMALVEDGLLDLDTPVGRVRPRTDLRRRNSHAHSHDASPPHPHRRIHRRRGPLGRLGAKTPGTLGFTAERTATRISRRRSLLLQQLRIRSRRTCRGQDQRTDLRRAGQAARARPPLDMKNSAFLPGT